MSFRLGPIAATVSLCLLTAACNYTFQAGAGLPPHVSTIAVSPFENETGRFELSQEVYDIFLEELPSAFGLRIVSEEYADAVIRGSIRSYSVDAPSYRPAAGGQRAEVVERRVSMTVHVQVIDRANNLILWDNTSLSARGEYAEASELEEDGRRTALERLAQAVIDGIQSNW